MHSSLQTNAFMRTKAYFFQLSVLLKQSALVFPGVKAGPGVTLALKVQHQVLGDELVGRNLVSSEAGTNLAGTLQGQKSFF